jgi:transcriptional antiterminator NusG
MTTDAVMKWMVASFGAAASANPDLRWYIVHAYSGMEKAVERNIQERIGRAGMQTSLAASWCRPKRWWR